MLLIDLLPPFLGETRRWGAIEILSGGGSWIRTNVEINSKSTTNKPNTPIKKNPEIKFTPPEIHLADSPNPQPGALGITAAA